MCFIKDHNLVNTYTVSEKTFTLIILLCQFARQHHVCRNDYRSCMCVHFCELGGAGTLFANDQRCAPRHFNHWKCVFTTSCFFVIHQAHSIYRAIHVHSKCFARKKHTRNTCKDSESYIKRMR